MKMKFLLLIFAFTISSFGQSIFTNPITAADPSLLNPYTTGQIIDANMTVSGIGRGTGIAASSALNRYSASGWSTAAIDMTDYFEFTLNPNAGYKIDLVSFVYTGQLSSGTPSFAFRSSADGYSSNIGAPNGTGTTISLSAAAYQNVIAPITFRIYAFGMAAAGTTFSINDFTFNGAVTTTGPYSVMSGDWNVASTWSTNPVIPVSTDNVTITAGHTVYTSIALTRTGTTTVNGTFQINNGGYASGTNFNYNTTTGSLNFNTTTNYGIAASDVYWPTTNSPINVSVLQGGIVLAAGANRTVSGIFSTASSGATSGVQFPTATLTLNGTCRIDNGGFFNNSPVFGASSTLVYNAGVAFGRGFEWSALGVGTIGSTVGYPNNVQLSGNTNLNYTNGTPLAKAMNGNLTVDAGSTFSMDYGSVTAGGFLTVAGNVTVAGTLRLGFAPGDDLKTAGNISFFTGTGTLVGNSRAIFFTKAGIQTVSSTLALTIPYVVLTTGSTTVQLLSSLTVSAPAAGNAITFAGAGDTLEIGANTLTIGSTVGNTISGAGTFKGITTSNLSLLGTGSIGTLNFTTGFQNLGTFLVNRTAASTACVLGTPVTVNTALTLTNGIIDLAATTMTLASTCSNSFTDSANSFVISDVTAGGNLRKNVTATGTVYRFPIGDKTGTVEWSPATVNFSAGTFTTAYIGVQVQDFAAATGKHPSLDATTHYISRFWSVNSSGTITAPTYTFASVYVDADVNGTEASSFSNQWNGTIWTFGAPVTAASNTLSIGSVTTLSAPNDFTAGLRDIEINIKQGATDYLHNSTYTFATTDTGATLDVTFTIQNTGQQNLTLGVATITGNPVYTLFTNYISPVTNGGTARFFTIRFAPTAVGTFTGSISIPNNDTTGAEAPYVINFTGNAVLPAPEINVKGVIGANPNIVSGDITPNALDNTQFASTAIGSNQIKTFRIENIGSANLVLSSITNVGGNPGDFVIAATIPAFIAFPAGTLDFTIAFTPTFVGYRSTTLTIGHNDPDDAVELPTYNFLVEGTATCAAAANTITPTSGPVGTEVTINATTNNLTGATVSFNGVSATSITYVSATQIKVLVPAGATSGNLVTTNSNGCTANNTFTVVNSVANTCQGGNIATDLFISEVTDSNYGGLTYVEIYNGTGVSKSLGGYSIQVANNGGAAYSSLTLSAVSLASGSTFVIALGDDNLCGTFGGDGNLAAQISASFGVNFDAFQASPLKGNDHYALFNGATKIDSWGTYLSPSWAPLSIGTEGATFRRKNTATVPTTTYSNSDWNIVDFIGTGSANCSNNDYSDIGIYSFLSGTPPTVTLQPTYTPSCKATTLTVAGAEGFAGGLALSYQWFGVAPNVAAWTSLVNIGVFSGVTTTTLTISNLAGLDNYQFYCQIRENTNTCYVASNPVKIIEAQTVTFNTVGGWTPSAPTSSKIAVINGNYDTTINGDIDACSLIINSPYVATITGTHYINIENDLTVNGTLNIQNNGSLVQVNDAGVNSGSGTTTMNRDVSIRKQDYVYWSSPFANFPVTSISPTTLAAHIWKWIPTQSGGIFGTWVNTTENMVKGKGYIVRGPSAFTTTAATFTASFTGTVPFTGLFTTPIERGNYTGAGYPNPNPLITTLVMKYDDNKNLLGNPYPSSIKSLDFLAYNTNLEGSVSLWTHGSLPATGITNPFYGSFVYNYNSADYIVFNGTGTSSGPGGFNGYIAAGQGFFVTMSDGPADATQTVTFKNSFRNKTYGNSQFYRQNNQNLVETTIEPEKHRIWLDLISSTETVNRTLVGFIEGATNDKDRMYDAYIKVNADQNFYSLIGNDKVQIQGRSLPFETNDSVHLGMKLVSDTTYKIGISAVDGLFLDNNQSIYLEDTLLNIIYDLRQAPYSFTSGIGMFDDRFILRFNNGALGTTNYNNIANNVIVSSNTSEIKIKSFNETISDVIVYDILGREIYQKKSINSNEFSITDIAKNHQALILKIILENGQTVSRKIIF